ncbi:MAG: triose-phosphate isomerase [Anaerolineae bacterium]|jgi:triosephosphate isomerase|nr:triose-phosphate isomerase [Anaerolineae bacterium]
MTRTPIVAANWKMNLTLDESRRFINDLVPQLIRFDNVERVICPTFIALPFVADRLEDTPLKVGAQNVHWETSGAFTSQIAPPMLQGLAEYVIIGHSEVRQYLNETDEIINRKVKAALAHGLKPILAVGESDALNQAGSTHEFVSGQLRAALQGVSGEQMQQIVIAYEPIWAIGTGRNATGEFANEIVKNTVRGTITELYGETIAQTIRIQYGGSVKSSNMEEYMQYPDIDGALVGGASLKVDEFVRLVEITDQIKG